MPYSQLWLALVVGWLMALHPWRTPVVEPMPLLRGAWQASAVLSVALLVFVVYRDLPGATERSQHYIDVAKSHLQPRFWVQGVIAPHIR
jgi:putative inorganic carbon (HCO3(-)) transporter